MFLKMTVTLMYYIVKLIQVLLLLLFLFKPRIKWTPLEIYLREYSGIKSLFVVNI